MSNLFRCGLPTTVALKLVDVTNEINITDNVVTLITALYCYNHKKAGNAVGCSIPTFDVTDNITGELTVEIYAGISPYNYDTDYCSYKDMTLIGSKTYTDNPDYEDFSTLREDYLAYDYICIVYKKTLTVSGSGTVKSVIGDLGLSAEQGAWTIT